MKDKRFDEGKENCVNRQVDGRTGGNTELDWAIRAGITDGSRAGDYATREETALMIAAALRYWTSCVFRMLNGEPEGSEYI